MAELKYPYLNSNNMKFRSKKNPREISWRLSSRILGKIALFIIIVYILSIILFDYLFPNVLPYDYPLYKFTTTLFVLIYSYPSIGSIFAFVITVIVFMRTKYIGYLFEVFIELDIILVTILLILLSVINPDYNFLFIIFFSITAFQYALLRKPLILEKPIPKKYIPSPTNLTTEDVPINSDILLRQYSFVNEYEDGYSSRPIFEDISDIFNLVPDNGSLKQQIVMYAKFLSINGDLIGYDIKSTKIDLFLRTAFLQRKEFWSPRKFLKKFFRVISKQNLTTITINLETKELDVKLNEYDYDYLNDVTFHLLAERMLQQFKTSLEYFLQSEYINSYENIYPLVIKSDSTIIIEKIASFLFLGYFIGVFLVGTALFYVQKIWPFNLSYHLFSAVFWPFMVYNIVSSPDSDLFLNPLIIGMFFATIIITTLIFLLINKFKWKKTDNGYKGLKIPN